MEDNFSPQQSLQLIQSMIEKARTNISGNRFYFLLWGWITFAAVISQFLLKVVFEYRHHYVVWFAVIPAAVITIVRSKNDTKQSVQTYVGESMGILWMGMGIGFGVLTFIISTTIGWQHAWPFFILFYGIGTFISGNLIRFKPLIFGGIFCWILACATGFFPYDYQLLFAATAILCSYIIPGHMIQSNKK